MAGNAVAARRAAHTRPLAAVLAAVTAMAVCAGDALAGDATAALTPVSLRLNWQMKGEFTPFIVAVARDYFRGEGLDVRVQEGSSGTQALQAIVSGQDDLAYVPSVQLIQAVAQGMPVKAVATVVKADSMAMVARTGVRLSSPWDLEGRTVEISAASTFSQIWPAFARTNGINVGRVNVVRVAPGARFSLLLDGKVDVLADIFMTNEYPVLQARTALNTLRVGEFGFEILGYTLAATATVQDGKPDVVRRFNAAAMKGFRFTVENPDEAAAIAVRAYPSVLPADTTRGQVEQLVAILKADKPDELFRGSDTAWLRTVTILTESGAVGEARPASAYYTNALVPAPGPEP